VNITEINRIADEEYELFWEAEYQSAVDRHGGDKVAGINEMQGFDFPDCLMTGEDFFEFCEEHGFYVPAGAIGGTAITSEPGTEPEFFFEDTPEERIRAEAKRLYWAVGE